MTTLRRAGVAMMASWNATTPGQRWTAGLGLALAALMALFGMPVKHVLLPAAARRPASGAGGGRASTTTATLPPVDLGFGSPPLASNGSSALDSFPSGNVANDVFVGGIAPPATPRVVALVRTATVAARDDASIAAVFLAQSGFSSTTVVDDPADSAVCSKTVAAGRFVVAGDGLEPALRDCLLNRGATVLSFDDLGAAAAGPGGQSFSTRRGVGAALGDLAREAPTDALSGRVGIVTGARLRPMVDAAIADMTAAGVTVTDVASLADDATNSDVADVVRRFAAESIDVVVFALPVARQRQWLAPAGVLLPSVRYVVADAYDSVIADETYPPTFDGAFAVTSVRTPWFGRAHAETAMQQRCRTQWEAATTPPKLLSGAETVNVYEWCEHVAVVAQVLQRAVVTGTDVTAALATARLADAPLTSALGPTEDDEVFGPLADAVLVWRNACACWTERTPFSPR